MTKNRITQWNLLNFYDEKKKLLWIFAVFKKSITLKLHILKIKFKIKKCNIYLNKHSNSCSLEFIQSIFVFVTIIFTVIILFLFLFRLLSNNDTSINYCAYLMQRRKLFFYQTSYIYSNIKAPHLT